MSETKLKPAHRRETDIAVAKARGCTIDLVINKHGEHWLFYDPETGKNCTIRGTTDPWLSAWDHELIPHYTQSTVESFGLLCEGIERFGGGGVRADMEEWEAGGLFIASFYSQYDTERRSTWLPFCEAICAAYLAACEADGETLTPEMAGNGK